MQPGRFALITILVLLSACGSCAQTLVASSTSTNFNGLNASAPFFSFTFYTSDDNTIHQYDFSLGNPTAQTQQVTDVSFSPSATWTHELPLQAIGSFSPLVGNMATGATRGPQRFQIVTTDLTPGLYVSSFLITFNRAPSGPTTYPSYTLQVKLYLTILAAVLDPFVVSSSLPTIPSYPSPLIINEGVVVQRTFRLLSRPSADVLISFSTNTATAIQPTTYRGLNYHAGWDGLQLSAPYFNFTDTNWALPQTLTITTIYDKRFQGDWTQDLIVDIASADSYFAALTLNGRTFQVKERDNATVVSSGLNMIVETSPTKPWGTFTVQLKSEPYSDVAFSMPGNNRFNIRPSTITFTNMNWTTAVTVNVSVIGSNVIFGQYSYQDYFPAIVSADPDYDGIVLPLFNLTIVDSNRDYVALSPNFAYSDPIYGSAVVTLTWPIGSTFLPNAFGLKTLPDVQCSFEQDGQVAASQNITTGYIANPSQVQCAVPQPCKKTSSGSCFSNLKIYVYINGFKTRTALLFRYLEANKDLPAVTSIEPGTVDLANYEWITIRGSNFDLGYSMYPDPTPFESTRALITNTILTQTTCKIGGILAPLVDANTTEQILIDSATNTYQTKRVIKCLSRPRPDLSGSSANVPVIVEVALNGQQFTTNSKLLNLFDYERKKTNTAWTVFFALVAFVCCTFIVLILQLYLCKNCCKQSVDDEEEKKTKTAKGPQMLIDLLTPCVEQQTEVVAEIIKQEQVANAEDEALHRKERLREIRQREKQEREERRAMKAEKKRLKEEKRSARAAAKAAAGGSAVEMSTSQAAASDLSTARTDQDEMNTHRDSEASHDQEAQSAPPAEDAFNSVPVVATAPSSKKKKKKDSSKKKKKHPHSSDPLSASHSRSRSRSKSGERAPPADTELLSPSLSRPQDRDREMEEQEREREESRKRHSLSQTDVDEVKQQAPGWIASGDEAAETPRKSKKDKSSKKKKEKKKKKDKDRGASSGDVPDSARSDVTDDEAATHRDTESDMSEMESNQPPTERKEKSKKKKDKKDKKEKKSHKKKSSKKKD